MTTGDTETFRCPSCGAPVEMGPARGTCAYCNTVVERPGTSTPTFATPHTPIQIAISTTPVRPRASSSGAGCVVGSVLLFSLLMIALPLYFGTNGQVVRDLMNVLGLGGDAANLPLPGIRDRLYGAVGTVPRAGAPDDLVAYVFGNDSEYAVALIDSTSGVTRWRYGPISSDAVQLTPVITVDGLYAIDDERLIALNLADGSLRWQVSLANKAALSCDGCLQVFDQTLVVLQRDGSLQGFDAATGQLRWGERLPPDPQALIRVDGGLLVRERDADSYVTTMRLIDAATGETTWQVTPQCADGRETAFDLSALVLPDSSGTTFLTIFEYSSPCAQRWRIGDSAPLWSTRLESGTTPSSWDAWSYHQAEGQLVIATDQAISTIDDETGRQQVLMQVDDYYTALLGVAGELAVVKATPSYDSEQHILWGIDVQTGAQRWQYALDADEWRGEGLFGNWDARISPAGILVTQYTRDTGDLVIERLDPATGASRGSERYDGPEDAVWWDAYWTSQVAWFRIGSTNLRIDLTTGTIASRF